jgi:hypothetical protein
MSATPGLPGRSGCPTSSPTISGTFPIHPTLTPNDENEPKCAGKAGEVSHMKEMYDQGLANQIDPESCVGVREDASEALTGARAGWLLSLVSVLSPGCRHSFGWVEGNMDRFASARTGPTPRGLRTQARTETPRVAGHTLPLGRRSLQNGSRKVPCLAGRQRLVRVVNPSRRSRQ